MINFVTSNPHKFREAKEILKKYGIEIRHLPLSIEEKRGRLEEIAKDAALKAFAKIRQPLFVEDSGLFVTALNGFPGEFSAWVYKKIGAQGILKLLEGEREREAYFRSVIAYIEKEGEVMLFSGECKGRIAEKIKGSSGFGYDPIFIPEGYKETFAERQDLKNLLSHRYNSLKRFAEYIMGRYHGEDAF